MIRELEITNFRCFRDIKLDNVRRFSVITGPNGSGKTALLEALFIAGGHTAEIYLRTSAWRWREEIPIPTSPSQLVPLVEDYFYQFDLESAVRVWFKDNVAGEREIRLVAAPQDLLSLSPPTSSEAISERGRTLKFFWKSPQGQIEAPVESTAAGLLRVKQPEDAYYMNFLNTATIGSAKQNADRYSSLSSKNQEGPIVDAVRRIFPQVKDLTVLSSESGTAIHATVRGVNRKIPLGLLSAGINKFVVILAAIASAPRGAVLIDEVENGWYHEQLTEMWRAIADCAINNNTQVFLTTHSKEFLQAIVPVVGDNDKDYCLLQTRKTNGECSIQPFSGKQFAGAVLSGVDIR